MKKYCLENLAFARKQLDCFGFVLKDEALDNFATSSLDANLVHKIDNLRPKLHELYSLIDDIAKDINLKDEKMINLTLEKKVQKKDN